MQYNSILFIFNFLPIFLAIYYIVPAKLKNPILLGGSILYYYFAVSSAPIALVLLLCITLLAYIVGRLIDTGKNPIVFWGSIFALLTVLVFFKIYDGGKHLPSGLSFYLFQIAAYLIRIYRGQMEAESNLICFGNQIMMFPKLLSGPLSDPASLKAQSHNREHSLSDFHGGLQEFIIGLSFKVLLANRVGGIFAQAGVAGYESLSPIFAWLAIISFSMKLYFDFHGYSLMACGLARMLGFHLPRNFDDPYAAKSVSDFYRRWHMTLGAWFREYIYIPLGGNRGGTLRTVLNLLVVWLLTGLWHGVGGNYLLWAGILVACIILERLVIGKFLKKSYVVSHIYLVFVILLSWVPFAIGDFDQMSVFYGRLFGIGASAVNPQDYVYWVQEYMWLLIAGVVFATPIPRKIWDKVRNCWLVDIVLFALFWWCVYMISTSAQDPFAYFQY